jgi:serine/threonine protein phosphatase 1
LTIQRFEKNHLGRDFVVGDIHGCFSKLKRNLEALGFNESTDRLFSVGDLVDRGKESHLVLDWLAKPWFHSVLGNHEQMAIDCANGVYDAYSYHANGGKWMLDLSQIERDRIAAHFLDLPIGIEVEAHDGIVGIFHADSLKSREDNHHALSSENIEQWKLLFLWYRTSAQADDVAPIQGYSKVFVGHTPMKNHTIKGNMHFIDNAAWHPSKYIPFIIEQIA